MKRVLFFISLVAVFTPLWAQHVLEVRETVTLKNGNIYKGVISTQLADGEVMIEADTSIVSIPSRYVNRIEPAEEGLFSVYINRLDSVEQVYQMFNYEDAANQITADSIVLSNFDEHSCLRNVKILEEGSVIRIEDTTLKNIITKMADIESIERSLINPRLKNWLKDEIISNNGLYEGQIMTIKPGKLIRMRTPDGKLVNIASKDIVIQRRNPMDKNLPIIAQTQFIDRVDLNDGKDRYEGVIIEQNFSDGTMQVIDMDNIVHNISLEAVSKIRKGYNVDYRPQYSFDYIPDSIYLDRNALRFIPYERRNDRIEVKINTEEIQDFKVEKPQIIIESLRNGELDEIKLISIDVVKGKVSIPISTLIDKSIPLYSLSQSDGVSTRIYRLPHAGIYMLVNLSKQSVSVFNAYR